MAVELALAQSESIVDHVGIWGAMVCQWARATIGAEPRFLSPALAKVLPQSEQLSLTLRLPPDFNCFRLLLASHRLLRRRSLLNEKPQGTLFSEEGRQIRSVVMAEVRAMQGWQPDTSDLAGGVWPASAWGKTAPPTRRAMCSTLRPRPSSQRTLSTELHTRHQLYRH